MENKLKLIPGSYKLYWISIKTLNKDNFKKSQWYKVWNLYKDIIYFLTLSVHQAQFFDAMQEPQVRREEHGDISSHITPEIKEINIYN